MVHRPLARLVLPLLLLLALSSCSKLNPIGLLLPKVPSVAANVQAGKTNTQQVVAQQTTVGRDQVTKTVAADRVDSVTVNNQIPAWVILLLVVGWLLPSPNEIGRVIRGWFKRGS